MQCSGIHRSLGVHISKVRSATLGTWLPEQVAFIQSMGNEKSNSYWEAELPPNYDRVGIENFIRAKYEEKRWIARVGKPKSPTRGQEDKASVHWQRPGERSGHGHISSSENTYEERKITRPPSTIATRISLPVPPKGPEQIGTLLYVRVVKANPGMNPKLSCIDASGKAAEFGQLKDGYMFESSTGLSRMLLSSPTCPVLDALGKKLSFETAVGLNGRVWAQAKYLEQVLREFHAHPAIKGIIMWSAWKPRGCYQICLTNNNFTNLPAGDVVGKLLREWGSGLDGTTDAEGFFETSLSHGVYEVKITHPNVSINSSLAQSQRFEVSSADTSEQTTLHLQVST